MLELDTGRLRWLGLFLMLLGSAKQVWIISAYVFAPCSKAQLSKPEILKETVFRELV